MQTVEALFGNSQRSFRSSGRSRIENCDERYLLAATQKLRRHLKGDDASGTHAPQQIGSVWLLGAHFLEIECCYSFYCRMGKRNAFHAERFDAKYCQVGRHPARKVGIQ
jgi:hypothetical protein